MALAAEHDVGGLDQFLGPGRQSGPAVRADPDDRDLCAHAGDDICRTRDTGRPMGLSFVDNNDYR